MSRVVVSIFALLLALTIPLATAARQTDPAASPEATAEPPHRETLGHLASAVAPGRELLLTRRTFQPGADSGTHPAPGPVVLFVVAGPVTFIVGDGGAALATVAGAEQQVAANEEIVLQTGDSVAYDEGVIHTVRNTGTAEAVTVEARLNPAETTATPAAATPAP